LLCPRPDDENKPDEARPSPIIGKVPRKVPPEMQAHPNLARVVRLNSFERLIFIMSVLERYSDQECSLLMDCFRRDVINARTAAIQHLASVVIATETQPARDVITFAGVNYSHR